MMNIHYLMIAYTPCVSPCDSPCDSPYVSVSMLEHFRDQFLEKFLKTDAKDPRVVWEHDEDNCIYDVFLINHRSAPNGNQRSATKNGSRWGPAADCYGWSSTKKLPIHDNNSGYADTPGFSLCYAMGDVIDIYVVYPDGYHEMYVYDVIHGEIAAN